MTKEQIGEPLAYVSFIAGAMAILIGAFAKVGLVGALSLAGVDRYGIDNPREMYYTYSIALPGSEFSQYVHKVPTLYSVEFQSGTDKDDIPLNRPWQEDVLIEGNYKPWRSKGRCLYSDRIEVVPCNFTTGRQAKFAFHIRDDEELIGATVGYDVLIDGEIFLNRSFQISDPHLSSGYFHTIYWGYRLGCLFVGLALLILGVTVWRWLE